MTSVSPFHFLSVTYLPVHSDAEPPEIFLSNLHIFVFASICVTEFQKVFSLVLSTSSFVAAEGRVAGAVSANELNYGDSELMRETVLVRAARKLQEFHERTARQRLAH